MNHAMVYALSHTLIHSLWQGALLSIVTGLILSGTRNTSAATRYNLLVSAMALFAVVVAGTFGLEFYKADGRIGVFADLRAAGAAATPGITNYTPASASYVIETVGGYLNRYGGIIAWIWLLIVCARGVQLAVGLREVHRLRHEHISAIGSQWEERVRQLSGQLGIRRIVRIAQSGLAKTPMVTGHLKPLILVPLGILTSLSPEEAESVLLHELAHIRRSDYLVNLLQNVLEIVLFFNPAVFWLSALIRTERENCCDDIAVARSGKVNYLKALVACEEYHATLPYAMALKSTGGGLKKRVVRILSNKNQSLNVREKSLLAVGLIAAGIFATSLVSGGNGNFSKPKSDDAWTRSMIHDLLQDGIIASPDHLSFKIGTDEFVVNYRKQPEPVYQKYRAKYVTTRYHGDEDWIWFYYFDTQKWDAMVAHTYDPTAVGDTNSATGTFRGKIH